MKTALLNSLGWVFSLICFYHDRILPKIRYQSDALATILLAVTIAFVVCTIFIHAVMMEEVWFGSCALVVIVPTWNYGRRLYGKVVNMARRLKEGSEK